MKIQLAGIRLPGNIEAKTEKLREKLYKKTKITTARLFFPFFPIYSKTDIIEKHRLEELRDCPYYEWKAEEIINIGKTIVLTGSPQDAWINFTIDQPETSSLFFKIPCSSLFLAEAETETQAEEAVKKLKEEELITQIRTKAPLLFLATIEIYNPARPFSSISWRIEWQKTAHKHKGLRQNKGQPAC
ncbi:hypothetical protein WKV44_02690 [Spirochaetia bacterium 38H-sp]|uniref:Uncharacterized protein n=1 Tax=Rarispira pelagica TaxID=3141764 RepID=A0ABU9U9U9_9SPIR